MQNQQNQQAIQSSIAFLEANGYSVSKSNGLPEADSEGWIENTGSQPVDDDTFVDIRFADGCIEECQPACVLYWPTNVVYFSFTHWRLSR